MTFFESSINSYTMKCHPPLPTALWELSESALEAICLPEDRNNAMFIAEPPANQRFGTMENRKGFITEPHYDARIFQDGDPEIINIPDSQNQSLSFDNNEIRRTPSRNKPANVKTHKRISYPSGDGNGIPYHLLVQMGLAKPILPLQDIREIPGSITMVEVWGQVTKFNGNVPKISEESKPVYKHSKLNTERISRPCELDESFKVCTVTKNTIREKLIQNDTKKCHERRSSLSQLFLSEDADDKIGSTLILDSAKCTKDDTLSKLGVSKTTYDDIEKLSVNKIVNDADPEAATMEEGEEGQSCGKTIDEAWNTSQVEETKNLEGQSSLSQIFQSQEFDVTHYRDIMSCGVSLSTDSKTKEISKDIALSPGGDEGDHPGGRENVMNQKMNDDCEEATNDRVGSSEELTVKTVMNIQPFIIKGCEPKMFDTSVKRKEDNPWKSEVRQGVLKPMEEVSNRGQQEMEEIPMVVSPYFPNENHHPVQDDKRTNLYSPSSYHNSQTISLSHNDSSKNIFYKIFEHEETEGELKLCKDFFQQSSNLKTDSGLKKCRKSKKDRTNECRKITNYFPVIKTSASKPRGKAFPGQDEAVTKFHDLIRNDGVSKKRKIDDRELREPKSNVIKTSLKNNRYEREISGDGERVPYDSRKFEDLGAGCIQYKLPSKHVFLDLPPGSVHSMSQLKPMGFDCQRSESTEAVIPSKTTKVVEMTGSPAKMVAFRRVAVEKANQKEKILLLEEGTVEETALEMKSSGDLFEIGFTLCYKEKYSVLNRPEGAQRKLHHPAGVMSRVEFVGGKIIRIYQSVDELVKENNRSFLMCLLESNCRKVCLEAQAFVMFVLEAMKEKDDRTCHDWLLLDPIVGMWLLNPDSPPHSFNRIIKEIDIKVNDCCNHPSAEWKDVVSEYMDIQSKVLEKLHTELSRSNLWDVFYHLETPLIPILAAMERRSIEVNYGQLKDISKVLQEKLNSLEQSAWTLLGKKFQLSSPLQLRTILYDELKLDEISAVKVKRTAHSGAKSTDEGTLKLLIGVHPLPALILEYRHSHKIKSTYIDGILAHVFNKTSVSTTWEQCAAATGRITSSSPNLQSIPKQEENQMIGGECTPLGFNVRKVFVSRLGFTFVAVDFQQIELRVFAHLSQDESLISAFQEPGDIFQIMTRIRIKKDDYEPSEREKTKTLMYALLYGAGAPKISELLSVDMDHATKICSDFYVSFPGLKYFRARVLQECRARKELRSLSGRRRLFPNIASPVVQEKRYAERQAVNFIIQGSAADICKAAMLRTEAALKEQNLQANLLLQIHDELLWEVSEEHASRVIEMIKKATEETNDYWSSKLILKLHLPVKITSGNSWGSMKRETVNRT